MTALIRWDPLTELDNLHAQVNSLFNDTFGSSGQTLSAATDVYSDDKALTVKAHLPNFRENEINVQQHDGELEIKAEHQEKEEDKNKKRTYLVRESVNQYYRRFTLPRNADAEKIKASFENGVLEVQVPYKELPQPKKIAIKARNK